MMNKAARPHGSFLKDNGLSIVLLLLFVIFLIGQALSGWMHYNEEGKEHGAAPIPLTAYLRSAAFGEAVFENWESEFLQMGLYVILTAYLFQRGSSESKDPDRKAEVDQNPENGKDDPLAPMPVRRGGWPLAIYNHSLFIAFALLFSISISGHAICGRLAANEEALRHGQPALSLGQYVTSSQFWFESFQNWQSEFLAIFSIVVLSIWLREKGSPESKPVEASYYKTGE